MAVGSCGYEIFASPKGQPFKFVLNGVDRRFVPPSAAYGYEPYTAAVTEIDARFKRDGNENTAGIAKR